MKDIYTQDSLSCEEKMTSSELSFSIDKILGINERSAGEMNNLQSTVSTFPHSFTPILDGKFFLALYGLIIHTILLHL